MSWSVVAMLVVGLILLVGGAEFFVRGASRLAAMVGISPLLIGLTVVALGTGSPEIAVNVQASLAGQADLALGNVIGSNIFNVLLILGVSALVLPLVVAQQLVRLDVPVMVAATTLLFLLALDGRLGALDGALLVLVSVAYVAFLVVQSRRESPEIEAEYAQEFSAPADRGVRAWVANLALIVGGLAVLVLGSRWLVTGAVSVAEALGVSQLVIGLTIVAAGTSLPEAATSVIATLRGERDIAVGNVVGSNIFNILVVLGLGTLVAPGGMAVAPSALSFDLPVLLAVSVACLPIFFTGNLIARWEGALFLGYYVAYTAYLVLRAAEHDLLPVFSMVMMAFVVPLTVITLLTVSWRALRTRRAPR